MKILYLAHRVPYPPNKGDKIRSFNEIKHLSKRHEIHLCCLADDPRDARHYESLMAFCKTVTIVPLNAKLARLKSVLYLLSNSALSVPYFYSHKLQIKINQLLSAFVFDCVFCFSSPMAEYVFRSDIKSRADRNQKPAKRIMDFVDVDSEKWTQYAKYQKPPFSWVYYIEGKRLAKYERKIAEAFHLSIFVSHNEAEIFKSFCPQVNNIITISNGVDFEFFSPSATHHSANGANRLLNNRKFPFLLFPGAMDYYPNIDGVVWFCNEILPRIKIEAPEVKFYIVGSNPHPKVYNLRNSHVIVTGFVKDIRPYYQAADICVIPLRMARGMQNKVLEAMAMGKAIVATSRALQGIEAEAEADQHLIVSDDPDDFATKIIGLLKDEEKRKGLGRKGRDWAIKNYQWSAQMNRLESLLSNN